MIAVLTGDVVNSRQVATAKWLPLLKESLSLHGEEPVHWEIFRGDSFQIAVTPGDALTTALHIKASVKQIKNLDVRIGIGIGAQDFRGKKISESNGSAFVRSGRCFEALKKQLMAVDSDSEMDWPINVMLALALLNMNAWSQVVSTMIKASLEHPEMNQRALAGLLGRSQSSVSEALSRGGYDEVMRMNEFFKNEIGLL